MSEGVIGICNFQLQADESYQVNVQSLQIVERNTVVTHFVANHLAIRKLVIRNQTVEYFPRGLPDLFPKLVELEITNCKLREITAEDLKGFEELEILDLSCNELQELPPNLFTNVKQLRKATFRNNNIKLKPFYELNPGYGLVDLTGNGIVNIVL